MMFTEPVYTLNEAVMSMRQSFHNLTLIVHI